MSLSDYLSSPFLLQGIQGDDILHSPNFSSEDQKQRLENEFCKDFHCCGLQLANLHQLLEHYEEYHLSLSQSDDEELLKPQPPPAPKEHIDQLDLNMLENPPLNSLQIQTIGMITDGLQTPSLSPTSPFQLSEDDGWYQRPLINQESEDDSIDRPYRCDIEDCDKAYKNANGLKYHRLHGHCPPNDSEQDANKPFVCSLGNCRKRYKNLNGLKYHIEHTHSIKLTLTSDMFIKPNHEHGLKRRYSSSSLSSE